MEGIAPWSALTHSTFFCTVVFLVLVSRYDVVTHAFLSYRAIVSCKMVPVHGDCCSRLLARVDCKLSPLRTLEVFTTSDLNY
jgi:hypothetical protein